MTHKDGQRRAKTDTAGCMDARLVCACVCVHVRVRVRVCARACACARVCCVLCAVCCVMCDVCACGVCVRVCCVLCDVCMCAVCCVLCAVCAVCVCVLCMCYVCPSRGHGHFRCLCACHIACPLSDSRFLKGWPTCSSASETTNLEASIRSCLDGAKSGSALGHGR